MDKGFRTLVIILICAFALPISLQARLLDVPTFQQAYERADLVVIAQPVAVTNLAERAPLPNIGRSIGAADLELPEAERGKVMATGVETTFAVETVVKGDRPAGDRLVLHHYRAPGEERSPNAPMLIKFDPSKPLSYLLFLKREADSRFAPVCGQTDPAFRGIIPADKIDLIAIARPVSAKTKIDDIVIPNMKPETHYAGFETQFAVQKIFKGDSSLTKLNFHHYQRMDFDPEPFHLELDQPYLLILKQDSDGRFKSSPEGCIDAGPGALAVVKLPDTSK